MNQYGSLKTGFSTETIKIINRNNRNNPKASNCSIIKKQYIIHVECKKTHDLNSENYHAKALSGHDSKNSKERHQGAWRAATQIDNKRFQKPRSKKDMPQSASSSANSTSSCVSQPPRKLCSTIFHPLKHLHSTTSKN